jgi:hypothetical protein
MAPARPDPPGMEVPIMVERKHIPVDAEYSVNIVTEQMGDGRWAVVSTIKHDSATGEKIIDLPVCDDRFASQGDAEDAGFSQAREWIDRNTPRAA